MRASCCTSARARFGEDGHFCKHCAAVAAEAADWGGGRRTRMRLAVTMDDVREHLMGYRKQALVDLVLARAEEDDGLRDQLLMTDFDGPLREDRRLPGVSAASGIDDRAHDQDVLLHVVVDAERRDRPVKLVEVVGDRALKREPDLDHPLRRRKHSCRTAG